MIKYKDITVWFKRTRDRYEDAEPVENLEPENFLKGLEIKDERWYFIGFEIDYVTFVLETPIDKDDPDYDYYDGQYDNEESIEFDKGRLLKKNFKTDSLTKQFREQFVHDIKFEKDLKDILA